MAKYNFATKINTPNFEIGVDDATLYGYFEHNELGDECGGGLWFVINEENPTKLELIDYDGVACLPKMICEALRENGYIISDIFE
jgi:hypothetical protein